MLNQSCPHCGFGPPFLVFSCHGHDQQLKPIIAGTVEFNQSDTVGKPFCKSSNCLGEAMVLRSAPSIMKVIGTAPEDTAARHGLRRWLKSPVTFIVQC